MNEELKKNVPVWHNKLPDSDSDDVWGKKLYVFDGNKIIIGQFSYHHSSMFIHDLNDDELDWCLWCWKDEMDDYLYSLY